MMLFFSWGGLEKGIGWGRKGRSFIWIGCIRYRRVCSFGLIFIEIYKYCLF